MQWLVSEMLEGTVVHSLVLLAICFDKGEEILGQHILAQFDILGGIVV